MVQRRIRDIKMGAPVLDGVVAAGANLMFGLTFTLNDPSPVEAQARALAVRDAATRARHFADAAGVRLGELLQLSEKSTAATGPIFRAALMANPPVPIEPGTLEITSVVEALYRFSR